MESHFKGKSAKEHLAEARVRGRLAQSEGHRLSKRVDSSLLAIVIQETLFFSLALHSVLSCLPCRQETLFFLAASYGWLIARTGWETISSWQKMEKVHRLLEQERWEVTNNRAEEREELRELYIEKGLTEPLLDQVVNIFMADDQRLLTIMMEEEMGIFLAEQSHPLKKGVYLFFYTLAITSCMVLANIISTRYGVPALVGVLLVGSIYVEQKKEQQSFLSIFLWKSALALLLAISIPLLIHWLE